MNPVRKFSNGILPVFVYAVRYLMSNGVSNGVNKVRFNF
jgi:hypothetical protein